MGHLSRRLSGYSAILAAALLMFAPSSQAPNLNISFVGSVFNCSDTSLNRSLNINFSTTGQTSGNNTLIAVDLGVGLGNLNFPVSTAEIQALSQAVSESGGVVEMPMNTQPVGPPGYDIQGVLKLSLADVESTFADNAPGDLATTTESVNTFVRTSLPAISNHISPVFRPGSSFVSASNNTYGISGMAAGDGDRPPIGAWASYSFTDSRNDFSASERWQF
jgi:hypothetical protein